MMTVLHIRRPAARRFLRAFGAAGFGLLLVGSASCRSGEDPNGTGPPITVGQGTGGDDDGGDDATPSSTAADDTGGSGGFDDSSWEGTSFVGDIHGLVQFTFSPAHALRATDAVGIVGGYRTSAVSWATEDLYSPVVYFIPFPNPPANSDTTAFEAMPEDFDYGAEGDWVSAGNGLVLRRSDMMGSVTACLQDFEVGAGEDAATYPVYATGKAGHDLCDGNASAWQSGAGYDVLLFGGEAFEDNELLERVQTPPELVVATPPLAVLGELVSASDGLSFTWEPSEVDSRIVIRIIDSTGAVLSAHAADDGAFAFEAADLAMLMPGSIDILIARERADRMLFTGGGLTVVSRFERWGFFELEA